MKNRQFIFRALKSRKLKKNYSSVEKIKRFPNILKLINNNQFSKLKPEKQDLKAAQILDNFNMKDLIFKLHLNEILKNHKLLDDVN